MQPVINHLWQSTIFTLGVAMACCALKDNHARTRYWLWLSASLKFLIPFSVFLSLGTHVNVPTIPQSMPAVAVEQISFTFAPAPAHPAKLLHWPTLIGALWLCGLLYFTVRWLRRWHTLAQLRHHATPLDLPALIPVLAAATVVEPGVFGIFRPVLLLPEGLTKNLTPGQFEAILAHEFCHVRHRDNLTAAFHMSVQTVFWFHPLVWWIGAKLVEERERACDEAVLRQFNTPEIYAQGILNVCKFYVESPLPCVSGVTGSDLKNRIKEIMTQRVSYRLTAARKMMLAAAAAAALCVPVVIGILRAQTLPATPKYTYDVVSIHPADPNEHGVRIMPGPQGGMRLQNVTAMEMLKFAYDVREFQFQGGPGWVRSDHYDVSFTPDKPESPPNPQAGREQMESMFNRQRQRTQAVLHDRFGLVLRSETKEMPIYALTIAKGGPKLSHSDSKSPGPRMMMNRGQITANGAYLKMLTDVLSNFVGRPVLNETGLDGPYDIKLEWTPEQMPGPASAEPAAPADAGGTSIFTAITEQLGLRLEPKKGPAQVYVIEKIEKPSEN